MRLLKVNNGSNVYYVAVDKITSFGPDDESELTEIDAGGESYLCEQSPSAIVAALQAEVLEFPSNDRIPGERPLFKGDTCSLCGGDHDRVDHR